MPTVKNPTKPGSLGHNGRVWKWTAVANGDTVTPVAIQGAKDITIFGEGTWGGGALGVEASPMIDFDAASAVYAPCKDLADAVIALTADGHSTVAQLGEYYRPTLTATISSIDIYILARY